MREGSLWFDFLYVGLTATVRVTGSRKSKQMPCSLTAGDYREVTVAQTHTCLTATSRRTLIWLVLAGGLWLVHVQRTLVADGA